MKNIQRRRLLIISIIALVLIGTTCIFKHRAIFQRKTEGVFYSVLNKDFLDSKIILPKIETDVNIPEKYYKQAIMNLGNNYRFKSFFDKLSNNEEVVVGLLGGSITQGAKSSTRSNHYSAYVLRWLHNKFPKSRIRIINAGIGATGSDYGATRLKRDLLSHHPDMVILEFAVNDSNTIERAESYEGIVRNLLSDNSKLAVLLLFMSKDDGTNAQELESKIGFHYNLPMVSYRDVIWKAISDRVLSWVDISPDKVHPNDDGHAITGRILQDILDSIYCQSKQINDSYLPKPLISDIYQETYLAEANELNPIENIGWILENDENKSLGNNWFFFSDKPESKIVFKVSGKKIFLSYWKEKEDMGIVEVFVDGKKVKEIDSYFNESWGGYRATEEIFNDSICRSHLIEISLTSHKNMESDGNKFKILGLSSVGINNSNEEKVSQKKSYR